MAIPCRACGREYDVTLFQFGRTIHCTCGARVGLEKRLESIPDGGPPRFLADAMLGRLARWLRVLGLDVAYDADISDDELVRRALTEERHILTRDRALPEEWTVSQCLVLETDDVDAQLREVLAYIDAETHIRLFTRCTRCNGVLRPVSAGEVRGRVPARVARQHDVFSRCPDCGHLYWEGSHTDRIRTRLARVLDR
jgi:uncharacterized protein with PIN domain